jgi:23S rRNA (cytosine1962-C5)-methyltransferase
LRRQLVNSARPAVAVVASRGARRWMTGHPWIFRSDVASPPSGPAGAVQVRSQHEKRLGWALWSPRSEIALRLLDRNPDARIDDKWWHARLAAAVARRASLVDTATAFRLIHGEADGCPSLICDRYDQYLVVQSLSAGLETFRNEIVGALAAIANPRGILARNDVPVRTKEGLSRGVELLAGDVPREVVVREGEIRYTAAPWDGQKTGAFLDQRENRMLVGAVARGQALDCFSYHGSFALHLARGADRVTAVDSSSAALQRAAANSALNGFTNISTVEADVFDFLRDRDSAEAQYDTIVLDPPAFAKTRRALPAAVRGYKEINLRAMRLLSPGGILFTASCSFHLSRELFLETLTKAASDSGRRLALRELTGQPRDHPEILTIPESGYLKGALIEAID